VNLQVIEVAIGVFAVFFLVSLIASAFVEILSTMLSKRAKDLDKVIKGVISDGNMSSIDLEGTSVYKALSVASGIGKSPGRRKPSYISARAFADGVAEAVNKARQENTSLKETIDSLPADTLLKQRLQALHSEVGDNLGMLKAGIETWFDDLMDRLQGAYKRWSRWVLLVVGLIIAAGMNVSTVHIVQELWSDATLSAAVADSASQIVEAPCPDGGTECTPEDKIEHAVNELESLQLPMGWGDTLPADVTGWIWMILGWIPTALAVTLGAPFWFDLLGRVAGLRGGRGAPPTSAADPTSATSIVRETRTTPQPTGN